MTVKELIELLKTMNPDYEVVLPVRDDIAQDAWYDLEDVYVDEETQEVQLDYK